MITALLLVSRILESIPPNVYTELDSDLKIKGGGGGRSSRPLDKGGAVSLPKFFGPFGRSLVQEKRGGGWAAPATYIFSRLFSKHFFKKLVERI